MCLDKGPKPRTQGTKPWWAGVLLDDMRLFPSSTLSFWGRYQGSRDDQEVQGSFFFFFSFGEKAYQSVEMKSLEMKLK